jgi:peptidoglycan/LPS O-acetylase OafA/YrhL
MNFKAIEFLRTFAALGVVWIHVWEFPFKAMSHNIVGVDVLKMISFVGNGVDFFFVISGFLMYLALYKKPLTVSNYFFFVKKRFFRIAPLYYLAIITYFFYFNIFESSHLSWKAVIVDAIFLNNHYGVNIAYSFWSLAVEWLFYLIVPFLFIFSDKKRRIWTFVILIVLSVVRLVQVELSEVLFVVPNMPLPLFMEFGWGVLIGMVLTNPEWKEQLRIKQSWLNLFVGFGILYIGRLMRLTQIVEMAGEYRIILKVLSGPVMTFGFAFIMYMLISSSGIFSKFTEHRIFQFLGKCSYGIYLWHVLIIELTEGCFYTQGGVIYLLLAYVIVVGAATLLSWITYELVEKLYFRSNLSNKFELESKNQL